MPSALRRTCAAVVLSSALTLVSCAGAPAAGAQSTVVAVGVRVTFDREVDPLPFDPRADRLRAASSQVGELVGHPVALQIDSALLPAYRGGFEDALVSAVESFGRELRSLRDGRPDVFSWAAPLVRRVECRYDATATESSGHLDAAAGTLRVDVHPRSTALVPGGLVHEAIVDGHDSWLEARYGGLAPSRVPAAEQRAYFRFRTGYRKGRGRAADLSRPDGYDRDPQAEDIAAVVELSRSTRDAALGADIARWLAEHGEHFTRAHVSHPDLAARAPDRTAFRTAERAWAGWVGVAFPSLPPAEKRKILETVFVRLYERDRERHGRFSSLAFRDLDPFGLALSVVDDWRRAGYPETTPDQPELARLFEHVVCPHRRGPTGTRERAPRCDYDLYDYALASPEGRGRLLQAVLARRDPRFTETVFIDVGLRGTVADVVELWRGVEADEAIWHPATRVVADELSFDGGAPLLDETRRLYRAYPARRGALLYVLAQMDRYDGGKVPWRDLPASYGGPVDERAFAAFLDHGHRAMSLASVVWPALGTGFSRARPIADRLEGWLADPLVRHYDFQDPWRALRAIVNRLCADRQSGDLALLHDAFVERARRVPSEARAWENLVADTAPGACRR